MIHSLRALVRSLSWLRQLRQAQQYGFVRSLLRAHRERQILASEPVITEPVGPREKGCELHILTWRGDWRLALWAAKSFYFFAGVRWPVVFHDGGGLDLAGRAVILRHFPQAWVVGWEEATQLVEPLLLGAGHVNLARARAKNVMFRKLIDAAVLARSPNMVCLDSDVLFVAPPSELVRRAEGDLSQLCFNRDSHTMYSITSDEARAWFNLDLPRQVNAGLGVLPVRLVDLAFLDAAFAPGRIPADRDVFPEQTACALLAARSDWSHLPAEYTVATGTPPLDLRALGLVSRHYVGPVRHLLYEEGIPFLLRETELIGSRKQ